MPQQCLQNTSPDLDAIIIGGGVAGLWLLNHLSSEGHHCILLEAEALGGAQTLASQGMVHGGIKYALGGALTGASEAIAGMPDRWRAALAGEGPVDLSGLEVLADRYYLFAEGNSLGKLDRFFCQQGLRGTNRASGPTGLSGGSARFRRRGLRPAGFCGRYQRPARAPPRSRLQDRTLSASGAEGSTCSQAQGGHLGAETAGRRPGALHAEPPDPLRRCRQRAPARALRLQSEPRMQLRPLHQVLVRHPELTPLYAHCVTGIRSPGAPTDHHQPRRWCRGYCSGIWAGSWRRTASIAPRQSRSSRRGEGADPLRALDRLVRHAEFETLRIDRAEPEQTGGNRPDEAYLHDPRHA